MLSRLLGRLFGGGGGRRRPDIEAPEERLSNAAIAVGGGGAAPRQEGLEERAALIPPPAAGVIEHDKTDCCGCAVTSIGTTALLTYLGATSAGIGAAILTCANYDGYDPVLAASSTAVGSAMIAFPLTLFSLLLDRLCNYCSNRDDDEHSCFIASVFLETIPTIIAGAALGAKVTELMPPKESVIAALVGAPITIACALMGIGCATK